MGKFRNKLKGQSKGKRWPKGQSSNSNPEIRKHRDMARSRFIQGNLGNSNLTSEALRQHDAIQMVVARKTPEAFDEESESSIGTYSSYKTMQSFASEWSDCSNMSYNRFLAVFRSDSKLHKDMLAVLAAIKDVIVENGGSETNTEYYCALVNTLEHVYNSESKDESQITAVLALLGMGIKGVPEAVLRKQFSELSGKMLHILRDYVDSDNNQVVKSVFGILAVLLVKQELAFWALDSTKQLFMAILNPFCIHSKPKWRKAAQQAVSSIVRAEYFVGAPSNVAADKVADFCLQMLDGILGGTSGAVPVSSVQAGQTTILHTLGLLKDTICQFSKSNMKKSCETVLRLMTLNYPVVTSVSLQALHALFSAQTTVVPAKLNAKLIAALYEYKPSATDVQPTLAWLTTMTQAHIHLSDVDLAMSCAVLPEMFTTMTELWLSDRPNIMRAATNSLEMLLKDAVQPACATEALVQQHTSKLGKCFNAIELGLNYQYHNVWHQVLHLVSVMFEVGGRNCTPLLVGCLKTLAELRDSYKFSYNTELEYAVGAAVRSMGPEVVLGVISLKKGDDLNMDRSWLLPILKENIKQSTISYFVKGILPMALHCQEKSSQLAKSNDGIGAHSYELLYTQLWSLLPCFCAHPTDIETEFRTIAKVLGTAISNKKELRLFVMAALRKLINGAKQTAEATGDDKDLRKIAEFDKNYLPILFNVYTTKPIGSDEEGQRLAALDTIKVFLSIASTATKHQLLDHAIKTLNGSSDDPEDAFVKESIPDLIRVLVPYQSLANLQRLFDECVKNLPQIGNRREQKKVYRLLEEICVGRSDECREFVKANRKEVQKLLRGSLKSAAVSSKGSRLKCLNYLVGAQPQLQSDSKLVRATVAEAVSACKDANVKTRRIAFEVLNTAGEALLRHREMDEFVAMVMRGLEDDNAACTVLALASILHNFSGGLGLDNIQKLFEKVQTLLRSETRDVVSSSLAFLKIYCSSLPSPVVGASLTEIVTSLCEMAEDCKRHFRLKVRNILMKLMRKFGYECITPHIPVTDTVMYKRLRNLRKMDARRKRKEAKGGENKGDGDGDDDDDDEFGDDEFLVKTKGKSFDDILADSDSEDEVESTRSEKQGGKKMKNTWIEDDRDNIIDFTDPSVARRISATKPKAAPAQSATASTKVKPKNKGFKTAPDGRLIIKDGDDDDDSSEDEAREKKKRDKMFLEDSESEEESESVAETLLLTNRKRKRSAAGSVKSGTSTNSQPRMKYKSGGVGIHRATSASSAASVSSRMSGSSGIAYRPKKAKGDMKKKGKHEPYAYLPLNRVNKRKKMQASREFKTMVKNTVFRGGKQNRKKPKKN